MRTMIEAFTSIFFISLVCVIFISFISSYMAVNNARNYHANVIDRLENSDYDEMYINELLNEAGNKGYGLTITNVSDVYDRNFYYVKLEYETELNVFTLINKMFKYKGVIEGYAT